MDQSDNSGYLKLFSELIKKQIVVLGPDITLAKVKNVTGITVDSSGNVIKIEGDPKALLSKLISEFVDLSGLIVKRTMESILLNYASILNGQAAKTISSMGFTTGLPNNQPNTSGTNPQQQNTAPVDLSSATGGLDPAKIEELNEILKNLDKN